MFKINKWTSCIEMSSDKKNSDLFLKIAYFTGLAGASILFGFSLTLNKHKKDSIGNPEAALYEEGASLARKALTRGTFYSLAGFSLFAFASYKLFASRLNALHRGTVRFLVGLSVLTLGLTIFTVIDQQKYFRRLRAAETVSKSGAEDESIDSLTDS